ncbi:MAG TPA: hypothetical protein ENJ35_10010 [Gammaproteobacteria bacterium]|nr:hypothetical protein [Gammaproteobacteria bacterium]
MNGGVIIIQSFFALFWYIFGQIRVIANASLAVAIIDLLKGVTDIIDQYSGTNLVILVSALVMVATLMAGLGLVAAPGAILAYSIFFNALSTIAFDAATQHFCQ